MPLTGTQWLQAYNLNFGRGLKMLFQLLVVCYLRYYTYLYLLITFLQIQNEMYNLRIFREKAYFLKLLGHFTLKVKAFIIHLVFWDLQTKIDVYCQQTERQ